MSPDRSRARAGRLFGSAIMGVVLVALTYVLHDRMRDPVVVGGWWISNIILLFGMVAFVRGRRFQRLPVAPGRIVAIVPAYEQSPADLRACVWSILNQRNVVVDEIHVVDDGSTRHPVQPFGNPRVFWHRKENGGKRAAQVYVLDRLQSRDWDFVLTVDGGSVLDEYALEHQLRAFSLPKVAATAGVLTVRNVRANLLTRITDLNIGTSYGMMRAGRSLFGTLETTPGAPAVYRAHLLFKHKERYLAADAYGDDRCLAMFAAVEGEVVGVNQAVAWSDVPVEMSTTYRQRLRWSGSAWRMIPFVLTNMDRFWQMSFPLIGLFRLVIAPMMIGYGWIRIAVTVHQGDMHWETVAAYFGLYLLVRYAATGFHLVERRGMAWREKLWTWLLLTPVEAAYHLWFLNPIKYLALLELRGTRGSVQVAQAPLPVPRVAGTVYFGDQPTMER
ncbi:glycosyltransferase family 2 protein [Micromonosporaceae bacterium Da 78-11]